LAVINNIDFKQGFSTGGQLISVQGYGFNSGNISAVIDGVPCKL
jgi:hypothetical protein